MKRRDFITKSTLGAAAAGTLLTVGNEVIAKHTDATKHADTASGQADTKGPGIKESLVSTDKVRSGIALGGIGAGGAEIRKDGIFYNWSIANNSPKGTGEFLLGIDHDRKNMKDGRGTLYPFQNDYVLFFMIRCEVEGQNPIIRLLQIEEGYKVAGVDMHVYEFPWMQGVEKIEFSGYFPFVTLNYVDGGLPVDLQMTTWSSFIPHDVKNSSLPAIHFDFKVKSKVQKPVKVMVTANYRSLVGYDVYEKLWDSEVIRGNGFVGQVSKVTGVDAEHSSNGHMGLLAHDAGASYQFGWGHRHQFHEWVLQNNTLRNTDDTVKSRNYKNAELNKVNGATSNYNSMAISGTLSTGQEMSPSFSMVWYFPNLYDEAKKNIVGHYYSNFFQSGNDVIKYLVENRKDLYARTKAFADAYYDSTAPQFLLELINSQLTTFITSGILGKNMEFGVLEGITEHQNWGPVGTTDVNMYGGVMVSSLFPELNKSTMRIHKILQGDSGEIRHSFKKGFAEALLGVAGVTERLDLHSQYACMVLRDFFWTNDVDYLREMWPSIKKALDYTLTQRDKNGDQQPDMTGIMSSYDNFPMYGMASYIQTQWLAALAGALKAAATLGDAAFVKKYTPIFENGKKLAEQKLWNNKYYRLYNSDLKTMKSKDGAGNEITKDMSGVDEGCLTDQIIGQWSAHWSGLGYILDKNHVKTALKNIVDTNFQEGYGLKNCSWPGYAFYKPVPEDIWVDQGNTVWSGVELSFVSFLLYEGLYDEALKVAETVHNRYLKAGRYWDHQEFGGHYFRAMGVWGVINGLLGLSINQGSYGFNPAVKDTDYKLFFSFPGGYGHLVGSKDNWKIQIAQGEWKARKVSLATSATKVFKATLGAVSLASSTALEGKVVLDFKKQITVKAGETLSIS